MYPPPPSARQPKKMTCVHLVCTRTAGLAVNILRLLLQTTNRDVRLIKDVVRRSEQSGRVRIPVAPRPDVAKEPVDTNSLLWFEPLHAACRTPDPGIIDVSGSVYPCMLGLQGFAKEIFL